MILNGNDIKKLMKDQNIVEMGQEEHVSSGSLDVSMSSKLLRFAKGKQVVDLRQSEKIDQMYEEVTI